MSSAAARAGHIKFHLAGGLLNGSGATAGGAGLWRTYRTGAMACFASVQARNLHFLYAATHGIPKIYLDLVLEVATWFFFRLHGLAAASTLAAYREAVER